jgi:hypothetical protein
MRVINTIKLNKRVKIKTKWDFDVMAIKHHSNSFIAPMMLKHLMNENRIRLFPYDHSTVALQIYEDKNVYQLKRTLDIIQDEIDRMETLDKLTKVHY